MLYDLSLFPMPSAKKMLRNDGRHISSDEKCADKSQFMDRDSNGPMVIHIKHHF